jgi:hypothetical protein
MSLETLEKFIPNNASVHLRTWVKNHGILFKITNERATILGSYKKLNAQNSHQITINGNLPPEKFFFVLTHELAHLKVRELYGQKVLPHGTEWKTMYRGMLLESIQCYALDLQPLIIRFSKSPKANFMASNELVYYFLKENLKEEEVFLTSLSPTHRFLYKKQEHIIIERRKKNYLCKNLVNGKMFVFQPLARVQKIE